MTSIDHVLIAVLLTVIVVSVIAYIADKFKNREIREEIGRHRSLLLMHVFVFERGWSSSEANILYR